MELLVVVAVIGVLAGLIVPALAYGRFQTKVTVCTGNFRQWGIASATYATDDKQGRLPSFELPTATSQLAKYRSLEPWFVAIPMITNMGAYGVTPRMWFCPTRESSWKQADDSYKGKTGGRGIVTAADFDAHFHFMGSSIGFGNMFWWVPRALEGSTKMTYPDPSLLRTRIPDPWPTKMDDASASIQPIASDSLAMGWDESQKNVIWKWGGPTFSGHSFGGKVRNNSALFADGHVETRPSAALKWQLIAHDSAYLY